jgi:putative acetyltransferase
MPDQPKVAVVHGLGGDPSVQTGLEALLVAYHLQTEAEKGKPVSNLDGLPERYRREILNPREAFADAVVLVALNGSAAVGCLVLAEPMDGRTEVKRLWTDPLFRGRGVATALISSALVEAADQGVRIVRLSVWNWRTAAIALYARLGFTVVRSWDEREQLVCMERALAQQDSA